MKIIILLPIVLALGACTDIEFLKSNTAVIKDDVNQTKAVDAIVHDDSTFSWSDITKPFSNTSVSNKVSVKAQAIEKLKSENVSFTLYFTYDDVDIDNVTTQEIIKHANFMRNNPNIKLRLEGHADERGTREYNLALGENRALSVKEVLGLYEGLDGRIEVISYGEEKPIAEAHDESGWGKNRRVEFIYK